MCLFLERYHSEGRQEARMVNAHNHSQQVSGDGTPLNVSSLRQAKQEAERTLKQLQLECEDIMKRIQKQEAMIMHTSKLILLLEGNDSDNRSEAREFNPETEGRQNIPASVSIKHILYPTNERAPMEMVRPYFQPEGDAKRGLNEIILRALNDSLGQPVTTDDLVRKIYDTRTDDEFNRARNSLSSELRRGAKDGKWRKLGRSFYASLSYAPPISSQG